MARFILIILILSFLGSNSCEKPWQKEFKVQRVIDGDTLIVKYAEKNQRIRLLGIDTPEISNFRKGHADQCFGQEAKKYLKNLVEQKKVLLTGDSQSDFKDKYGRTLAWVYLDGQLVNFKIIESGHGFAVTNFPNSYSDKILALEKEAKRRGVGVWSKCSVDCKRGYCEVH